MSYLYTGTPALKTDFTRTGKRTMKGAFDDGVNSLTRYFINNFTDGYYHDCLDIATCQLQATSEIKKRSILSPINVAVLGIIFATMLTKFLMESYLLLDVGQISSTQKFLYHFAIGGTFLSGILYVVQNGKYMIDDSTRYV